MSTKIPTLEELNAAQAEWTGLELSATDKEKHRVIKLYESVIPKCHIGVSNDKLSGAPMIDGCPIWSQKQPIETVVRWAKEFSTKGRTMRTDVAWCGSIGRWVAL